MKATGIVRRLDDLGRITLPIELRRSLDVTDRDPLEIFVEEGQIVLKKYSKATPKCAHCGSTEHLKKIGNSFICTSCMAVIRSMSKE